MNRHSVYINIMAVLLFILNIFSHIDTMNGNNADLILHDVPCCYCEEDGVIDHFYHQISSANQNTISDSPTKAKKNRRNFDNSLYKYNCEHTRNKHNKLIHDYLHSLSTFNSRFNYSALREDIFIIIHKLLI